MSAEQTVAGNPQTMSMRSVCLSDDLCHCITTDTACKSLIMNTRETATDRSTWWLCIPHLKFYNIYIYTISKAFIDIISLAVCGVLTVDNPISVLDENAISSSTSLLIQCSLCGIWATPSWWCHHRYYTYSGHLGLTVKAIPALSACRICHYARDCSSTDRTVWESNRLEGEMTQDFFCVCFLCVLVH